MTELRNQCGCIERNDQPQFNQEDILFPTGVEINAEDSDDGILYPSGITINYDKPKRGFDEFIPAEIDDIPLAPSILSPSRSNDSNDCDGDDDDLSVTDTRFMNF